ncbi:MAG: HupE/UreJ family protein [Gemmatimonadales bacterium]|nr:HupE/UreJ family protein [Gemmatimonadales bacterium]
MLLLALWLGSAAFALLHDPGLSAADLRLEGGRLVAHLSFARLDIERLVQMDADGKGGVSPAELAGVRGSLEQLAREAVEIRFEGHNAFAEGATVSIDTADNVHFQLTYTSVGAGTLSVRSALLDRLPRGHRQYLTLRDASGKLLAEQMLDAKAGAVEINTRATASGTAPRSFRQFLALGIHHILTGYDHLLFLFALLLPGYRLRTVLAIITSFTLAHSLTLSLATLDLVRMPSSWVEPLIALSIVYVGVENVLRPGPERRWLLTFGFGLVHGFGFAAVLRDLGIGAGGGGAVVPLLSFNLGVEVGQIAIAALLLPLIWKLGQYPALARRAVTVGSVLVALAGGYWLLQRTVFS